MATLHPPLNLNTVSLQDMLDVGWIPPQDAEEIVRQRGPSGRLYLARLLRTTSLYQMKLDQLIQQGMITVHFQDDDNLEETQSLLSDTSSMREEMEAMREENRLLREAMEQQTRLQQDVLARFVDEMATRDRSNRIAVREQQDNSARRTAVTQELSVGRTSTAMSGLEGADESLAWDAMGQPMPLRFVPRSTNPFVTPSVSPQASLSDRVTRSSGENDGRYVLTGRADTREQEGRAAHVDSGLDQGPALLGPRANDNVWAELQRLSLQMDLLLTNARQSQVIFQDVGPSPGAAQVRGDELGRQSSDHRAMSELVSGPARTGYTEPQFPLRYGSGMPWNGHQYVAGGQMDVDLGQRGNRIGGGPAPFWSQQEQPQSWMQAQRHPQPWVPDMVSVGGRCDVRDAAGSGRWGQCLSGYTDGEERSAVRGGYRDPQTRSEYVSSEESDSHSRQSRKSHHRNASSRRTLRTRRSLSRWRKPSPSSSSSRSPSAASSARRRHRSPPLPKPQVFAGKKGEWNGFIYHFRKTARYFGWSQREKGDRLLASLRGKAVDFIMSKPREVQDDYQALKDALEVRFGKMEHPTSARRQLGYLRQEEGETLEDYNHGCQIWWVLGAAVMYGTPLDLVDGASAFPGTPMGRSGQRCGEVIETRRPADKVLTKVSEAYPGIDDEMEQDLAKEAFLRGCHHRSAAYAAAKKDPVTLQEALEEVQNSAVNLKAFSQGGIATRRVSFARQEDEDEEVNTQVNEEKFRDLFTRLMREYEKGKGDRDPGEYNGLRDQTEPSNAIRCYRCGGRGHMSRECRKEGRRCFACGEVGHMRADCPGKRGAQSSSWGRGKNGHLNWIGSDT